MVSMTQSNDKHDHTTPSEVEIIRLATQTIKQDDPIFDTLNIPEGEEVVILPAEFFQSVLNKLS